MKSKVLGHAQPIQFNPVMSADTVRQHDEELKLRISVGAYYKAKSRGFMPGHELDDWLMAEAEVLSKQRQPIHLGLKATLVPSVQVDLDITK